MLQTKLHIEPLVLKLNGAHLKWLSFVKKKQKKDEGCFCHFDIMVP